MMGDAVPASGRGQTTQSLKPTIAYTPQSSGGSRNDENGKRHMANAKQRHK